jgi:maltooligosyltrehalose trehalohydrolase
MSCPSGWFLERGANVQPGGTVRFSVWAPLAQEVGVHLCSDRGETTVHLEGKGGGVFEGTVEGVGAGTDYSYTWDGRDRPDPVSRYQPHGVHGPSRVVDPRGFHWSDGEWTGREMADLILYELHVGAFTEEGTFDAAIVHLPALRDLGITAIELMPVSEFPGGRNWGYDGVHPFAPQSTYGGPEGLRRLVDAAHREDLAVILDVVYNHLGPDGNYLGEFGPYFTDSYRTPWGPAMNFDGPDSDAVRRYFVDNALYWITEFHVDGLRLDAVHAIFDFSACHILDEIADRVRAQAGQLGRRAVVIAESDLNDPRLVRSRNRGGYGLDAQWSDDFHHAVHAALTQERDGYYRDFGGVAPVAKALRDRFVYDGRRSCYRRRRHGAPASDVPADRFVVFMQNHDQVGNRAQGERLAQLVSFDQQKLAAALLLLSPYVPLLFMGEEYGETNPFLYFVSHGDPALVEAVREGRRREFAAFAWRGEVPDPQAEETFTRSRLERARSAEPCHRELLALYRDLLQLRRTEVALRPGDAEHRVASDPEAGWVTRSFVREGAPALVAAFNFGQKLRGITLDNPSDALWHLQLTTDAERYGGTGSQVVSPLTGTELHLTIPQCSAVLYRAEGG